MFPAFSGSCFSCTLGAHSGATARFDRDSRRSGTYEIAELAQRKQNEILVERLATLESTFGRSDGMLTEVFGTSLRGLE
jgi:hypothetical protein